MPARPYIFITHEYYPRRGGIATFVEEMAHGAAALGHAVEVWAQRAPACDADAIAAALRPQIAAAARELLEALYPGAIKSGERKPATPAGAHVP